MVKLNAKQLRTGVNKTHHPTLLTRNSLYVILDNVLDTYNIGSVFRLCDATGVKRLYLCGGTETPPNHRIKKASINTTEIVDWQYCPDALEAIKKLKALEPQVKIIAVEQSPNSIPYTKYDYQLPICLVVGHESEGVSQEVLEISDATVELPMFGLNTSLNVMVSLGIVLFKVLESVNNKDG